MSSISRNDKGYIHGIGTYGDDIKQCINILHYVQLNSMLTESLSTFANWNIKMCLYVWDFKPVSSNNLESLIFFKIKQPCNLMRCF